MIINNNNCIRSCRGLCSRLRSDSCSSATHYVSHVVLLTCLNFFLSFFCAKRALNFQAWNLPVLRHAFEPRLFSIVIHNTTTTAPFKSVWSLSLRQYPSHPISTLEINTLFHDTKQSLPVFFLAFDHFVLSIHPDTLELHQIDSRLFGIIYFNNTNPNLLSSSSSSSLFSSFSSHQAFVRRSFEELNTSPTWLIDTNLESPCWTLRLW